MLSKLKNTLKISLILSPFAFLVFPFLSAKAGETESISEIKIPCKIFIKPADVAEFSQECDRMAILGNNPLKQAQESSNQPARRRLQPSFSEEERKGFDQKGFSNFLIDALNGNSDPLGGGTISGGVESNAGLSPISPQERGIIPTFDPTDVIIPRSGVRR